MSQFAEAFSSPVVVLIQCAVQTAFTMLFAFLMLVLFSWLCGEEENGN